MPARRLVLTVIAFVEFVVTDCAQVRRRVPQDLALKPRPFETRVHLHHLDARTDWIECD